MEPIGAAASLITLLATARGIFNDGCDLYKAIEDAPNELRSVSLKATLVRSTLEQILALRPRLDDGEAQLVPLDLRMGLALSLEMSYEALQKLKRLCSRTGDRGDLHLRLRWALLEKRAVRDILQQLGSAENDLAVVLQVLHMYVLRLPPVNNLFTSTTTLEATSTFYGILKVLSAPKILSLHNASCSDALMGLGTAKSVMK